MWRIFTDCDLNSHLERTFGFFSNENVIESSLLRIIKGFLWKKRRKERDRGN